MNGLVLHGHERVCTAPPSDGMDGDIFGSILKTKFMGGLLDDPGQSNLSSVERGALAEDPHDALLVHVGAGCSKQLAEMLGRIIWPMHRLGLEDFFPHTDIFPLPVGEQMMNRAWFKTLHDLDCISSNDSRITSLPLDPSP